jgi:hypothetical protein
VAESVDAADSKSVVSNDVPVRVGPGAPSNQNPYRAAVFQSFCGQYASCQQPSEWARIDVLPQIRSREWPRKATCYRKLRVQSSFSAQRMARGMTNILAMRSDPAYAAAVDEVTEKYDADILVCCCNLFSPSDVRILSAIRNRKQKRKNLLVILTTPGGLADSAYRIGRGIQHHYKTLDPQPDQRGKFYLFIPRWCKSAGTLLALGADGLVMSQMAELGPIDAQLRKEDEVGDWTSGLTAIEALTTLQEKAASLFLKQFKEMRFARETRFSTRMATDIAARITTGLLDPIYAQIDPMRLGSEPNQAFEFHANSDSRSETSELGSWQTGFG